MILGFVFIRMYFLFGFETHLSLCLWRLQTLIPQISILPDPMTHWLLASSQVHMLEANLEAGGLSLEII